jgi:hypothetical protein
MYQDAKNAELPAARNNLELGTVKSEGGDPPDTLTSFYTWGGTRPQFQVLNNPQLAAEWVAVQAGVTGGGATHLCTGYSPNVQCNYVGLGTGGHLFGNGFGSLLNLQRQGTGSIKSYFTLWGSGDATARIDATASAYTDVDLQAKAKGAGHVVLRNDIGKLGQFESTGGAPPDAFLTFQGANGGINRVIAGSDTFANVVLELTGKGDGEVRVRDGQGTLATFLNSGTNPSAFVMTAGTGATAAVIAAPAGGVRVDGQRVPMTTKTASYTVLLTETGAHFDNVGATGAVTFTLPAATRTFNYCFTVDAVFSVIVKAAGSDKIALAAANSAAGGQIAASAPYASACIESHKAGQWLVISTPDKTQWTVT